MRLIILNERLFATSGVRPALLARRAAL